MMKAIAIAALLAVPLSGAYAQEDPPLDCANAQTQADMNQCSYLDFEKADKALNAVYRTAVKSAQAADKQAAEMGEHYVGAVNELKKAQRAWIDYRDGHCEGMSREALGAVYADIGMPGPHDRGAHQGIAGTDRGTGKLTR
jgi:uncharacterized protein YecT (DUF1311 family)